MVGYISSLINGSNCVLNTPLIEVSWISGFFSRGTFLWMETSLYLSSFLSYIDSRERVIGDFLIVIHSLLAFLSDDSLMWGDFHVWIKDASFQEEHFCHWNHLSISPHSWVSLILVREPLSNFWLWSMVLLAYLSDDSLLWANFQVYIKDASFIEEHFCHWNLRSTSSHSWIIWILVRNAL